MGKIQIREEIYGLIAVDYFQKNIKDAAERKEEHMT